MAEPGYSIHDDFLDEESWGAVWSYLQFAELHPVSRTAGAWRLEDGVPLGGDEIVTPERSAELVHDPERPDRYPSETALDEVVTAILSEPSVYEGVVGDDWAHLSARAYVYPRGSGLSWHKDDHARYAGAFIYYAHPHWNVHWGGELLLADEDPEEEADAPIMAYRFESEPYSERLLERGTGRFIAPKPNRLVVLSSAHHAVAPVASAAGSHVRASVSGFFLREGVE